MNKSRKIMRALVTVLALVICMAPLSLARAEYSFWQNVVYDGEMTKVGIRADDGILPTDAKFTIEWTERGFFDFSIWVGEYPDAVEINLEKGKYVQLYVQIPEGVNIAKLQTQMICSQYDPEIVEIDDISYLMVKTDDFATQYIDSRIPDAGDSANLALWTGMMVFSVAALIFIKKREFN